MVAHILCNLVMGMLPKGLGPRPVRTLTSKLPSSREFACIRSRWATQKDYDGYFHR